MTDGRLCSRDGCTKLVFASSAWYPFCSNECEQRAQLVAERSGPGNGSTRVEVRQLGLEDSKPWQPERFSVGTLEDCLVVMFEAGEPKRRFLRAEMRDYCRSQGHRIAERDVTNAISNMRLAGWPICSSSGEAGYWLSWDNDDLDTLEQNLRGRSLDMLKKVSGLRRFRQRVARLPILDEFIEHGERGEW